MLGVIKGERGFEWSSKGARNAWFAGLGGLLLLGLLSGESGDSDAGEGASAVADDTAREVAIAARPTALGILSQAYEPGGDPAADSRAFNRIGSDELQMFTQRDAVAKSAAIRDWVRYLYPSSSAASVGEVSEVSFYCMIERAESQPWRELSRPWTYHLTECAEGVQEWIRAGRPAL